MPTQKLSWTGLAIALVAGCGDGGAEAGAADEPAQEACAHASHGVTSVTAASDPAEAPGVELATGEPYEVTIPASGVGYVVFSSPHEHYDWAFFVGDEATLDPQVVHLATGAVDHLSPSAPNGACPGEPMQDYRAHMHHMGLFLVEIHAEPGADVWMMIVGEPSDHHVPHDHEDHGEHHD